MTNHCHFLIQLADQPLGKIMQRIEMRYAHYRHKLMNVTGHLFEKPYTAKVVDVDNYCQEVIRYIHTWTPLLCQAFFSALTRR
jgi:hypothetical protein